jgi:hypothetical protein
VSWNLITDDWRLKLLAVGLAVLLLGAVAFSQNPPTSKTLTKSIDYTVPPGLIVINPPKTATVVVTGLADTLTSVTTSSVTASFDLAKATPGPSVKVDLVVKSLVLGVTVVNPIVPQALNIDQRAAVTLPVVVRTPRVTPGWQVTKAEARCPNAPCSVTFDGPVSMQTNAKGETNLKAYADFTNPVENSTYEVPTQPVVLEQNGIVLDIAKLKASTVPQSSLDTNTAFIHIEAKTGTTSRQVVLIDSPPTNPPPTCYRITDIKVDPPSVVISATPDVLAGITTITLPGMDLSKASPPVAAFKVTIPYPANVSGLTGTTRVAYSIAQNPNCTPPSP